MINKEYCYFQIYKAGKTIKFNTEIRKVLDTKEVVRRHKSKHKQYNDKNRIIDIISIIACSFALYYCVSNKLLILKYFLLDAINQLYVQTARNVYSSIAPDFTHGF